MVAPSLRFPLLSSFFLGLAILLKALFAPTSIAFGGTATVGALSVFYALVFTLFLDFRQVVGTCLTPNRVVISRLSAAAIDAQTSLLASIICTVLGFFVIIRHALLPRLAEGQWALARRDWRFCFPEYSTTVLECKAGDRLRRPAFPSRLKPGVPCRRQNGKVVLGRVRPFSIGRSPLRA